LDASNLADVFGIEMADIGAAEAVTTANGKAKRPAKSI
jgi:hypothetical protein